MASSKPGGRDNADGPGVAASLVSLGGGGRGVKGGHSVQPSATAIASVLELVRINKDMQLILYSPDIWVLYSISAPVILCIVRLIRIMLVLLCYYSIQP